MLTLFWRGEEAAAAGLHPPADLHDLSLRISAVEVAAQLRALAGCTAPGPEGVATEFYRSATVPNAEDEKAPPDHVLAPALADLFNVCLESGRAPADWQRALITPVYKTDGVKASFDGYRPIAVGSVVPKLYARVLNARLVGWAEEHKKHAPEQAGFRPEMNTDDHLFNLRHVWDVSQTDGEAPVYLAFVDLKQAYDRVSRPLLWAMLEFLGVDGTFLAAV